MFGFLNSSTKKDAPEQGPLPVLPELELFTPEFVEGITDNASLTAALTTFKAKLTSDDETIIQMKGVLETLIAVLPLLKNMPIHLTLAGTLKECVDQLKTVPLQRFPYTTVTPANLNDLKLFSEILLVLHYVLQEQVRKYRRNFMSRLAETVIETLIFAVKQTSAQNIQNLEEGLSKTAAELLRWQAVIKQRLDLYEHMKMLEAAQVAMIKTIGAAQNLSLSTLFEGIDALKMQMSRDPEPCQHLKTIKLNTFLIQVLDALLEKKIQGEEVDTLVSTLNESNAGLKVARTEVADVGEEEFENIGTRLSCETQSADSKYLCILRDKKYFDFDTHLINLHPEVKTALPESPGSDDDQFEDCAEYPVKPTPPNEVEVFFDAAAQNSGTPEASVPAVARVQDEVPVPAVDLLPAHDPTVPQTPAPTPASATSKPFLNARRQSEIMVSSTSLMYAGGVGLEALGEISFVSVIEPAFVAASFVSPVALIALSACALVVLIGIGEAAYSYHEKHESGPNRS